MSPTRGPKAAQTPPEPATDPLADLRDPDQAGVESVTPPEEPDAEPTALVTQEVQEQLRHRMVVAMHDDLTVQGFIHGGGVCGCWYITGVIANAVLPVQVNQDDEELAEDVG